MWVAGSEYVYALTPFKLLVGAVIALAGCGLSQGNLIGQVVTSALEWSILEGITRNDRW